MQHSTHSGHGRPDPRILGAYYDLWFEKIRGRAQAVGYSPSDRYNDAVMHRLLQAEVEGALRHPEATWLDYGCGPAHLFKEHGSIRERHRVGVDISPAIIAENRERFTDQPFTEFHTLDDGYLDDLVPGSFDCITCVEVLEHVYGVEELVERFAWWLRPGGTLVITTPNGRRAAPLIRRLLPQRVMLYLEDRVEALGIDELEDADVDLARFNVKTHFHEFAAPELKRLLQRHGLKVESTSLLALKAMPNRTFNYLAARMPGFVPVMEAMDGATRHWPIGFFKTCLMMVARRPVAT